MADDEQFSLCWNNFNTNLSAGFHESLCRGDLVDVTLAAEGQFVKAHRLVLSVCSPYFRKMFTQMPSNQHAFVFLKDVSHSALKDLIQFMYCGEVNVKQDALPAFISTAEALQIKGLTDSEPAPSQSPAKPSTPAPTVSIPGPSMSSPRVKQRSTMRQYKIESEDSGDDKIIHQPITQTSAPQTQNIVVQQTQKRPAQRSNTSHTSVAKRVKNSDPLEATESTQITVPSVADKASDEPEFIDLPIDIPTKSEPEYVEDAGDVEGEQETAYVEDDSYGDMKYDESYFTENDETGTVATTSATVKTQSGSFSETFVGDTGEQSTEAQDEEPKFVRAKRGRPRLYNKKIPIDQKLKQALKNEGEPILYVSSISGGMKINYKGHHYKSTSRRGNYMIYQCTKWTNLQPCLSKVVVYENHVYHLENEHNHTDLAIDKSTTEEIIALNDINLKYSNEKLKEKSQKQQKPLNSSCSTNFKKDVVEILNFKVLSSGSTSELDPKSYIIEDIISNDDEEEVQQKIQQQQQEPILNKKNEDNDDFMAPEDFKEKIKKRLQKALLKSKS